jgi:hypothetical protein
VIYAVVGIPPIETENNQEHHVTSILPRKGYNFIPTAHSTLQRQKWEDVLQFGVCIFSECIFVIFGFDVTLLQI